MLESDVDAVAIFTQRWLHGEMAIRALEAGKHVYSTVPMAIEADQIARIIELVKETGLTYMMGETSFYYPSSVYCRQRLAAGDFGRVFYAEGDYVHDMDLGFYAAYQYSGGEDWKKTASFPPMLYPTHAVGNVLSVTGQHATHVSCIGVQDDRGDGVFDKEISQFDNDFSQRDRALQARRRRHHADQRDAPRRLPVAHPRVAAARLRHRRQLRAARHHHALAEQAGRRGRQPPDGDQAGDLNDEDLANVDPALRDAFRSGLSPVHDRTRLPAEFAGLHNGHEGSHHFLADDFVRAVADKTLPPVNAWVSARYTLPGIYAHQSALQGGVQLEIPDHGDAPA